MKVEVLHGQSVLSTCSGPGMWYVRCLCGWHVSLPGKAEAEKALQEHCQRPEQSPQPPFFGKSAY